MASEAPRLDYGIELIEGPPGSGKSFYAVKRMLEVLEAQRRPVYTNLPLKWRVIRQYLRNRCGDRVASLIYELQQEHFERFMERSVKRAKYHDKRRDIKLHPAAQYQRIDAEFVQEHGPDVLRGAEANWIPQASLLVLDEVHKWFPMRAQSKENPHLLDYLSMHRHALHWVWAITQDKSNVSISFRKLYQTLVQVRNLREDVLLYGLKMKHVGLRGMGYRGWTREQVEGKITEAENQKPILDELVFPWLPHNQVFFRLYSSFSQMASLREIERALQRARESVGLDEIGRQDAPTDPEEEGTESWLSSLLASL